MQEEESKLNAIQNDSESEEEPQTKKRKIEQFSCEICKDHASKYTCPQCNRKTCSLACSQQHKQLFSCQGKRDRTAFVPLQQMSVNHLMSDYQFLQDVQQSSDMSKRFRDQHHISDEVFSVHGRNEKLVQKMALLRGIWMHLLPQGMEKWKQNTSYFDQKQQLFFWRFEFVFHNTLEHSSANSSTSKPVRIIERKVNETFSIQSVLNKYFTDPNFTTLQYKLADFIKEPSTVKFLLKVEISHLPMEQIQTLHSLHETKNENGYYYLLDSSQPIKEVLKEKVIVEYPIILCVVERDASSFALWNETQQQQYKQFRQEETQQRLQRKQHYLEKQKAWQGEEDDEHEEMDSLSKSQEQMNTSKTIDTSTNNTNNYSSSNNAKTGPKQGNRNQFYSKRFQPHAHQHAYKRDVGTKEKSSASKINSNNKGNVQDGTVAKTADFKQSQAKTQDK